MNLKINGKDYALEVDPRTTLLDALREHLHLTGSKKGCDHGQCGACTVLVNGRRINSCLTLALMHEGDEITTIEGLANGEELHPLQSAFIEHDTLQCGYCTPGQICLVCDQPFVNALTIQNLISLRTETEKPIVASSYLDTVGVPALFDRTLFSELLALDDSIGAKPVIVRDHDRVAKLELPEGGVDIDTVEQWDELQSVTIPRKISAA